MITNDLLEIRKLTDGYLVSVSNVEQHPSSAEEYAIEGNYRLVGFILGQLGYDSIRVARALDVLTGDL